MGQLYLKEIIHLRDDGINDVVICHEDHAVEARHDPRVY